MQIPGTLLQLAKASPMMGQIKQMMGMVQASQNPQALLNQLAMNNDKLAQVLQIVQQHGGDPMKALRSTAEQMGFNPDDIMSLLK